MMNTRLLAVMVAVGASLAEPSLAQDKPQILEQTSGSQDLQENYSIQLRGGYEASVPLDITLSGSGPEFDIRLCEPSVSFLARIEPNDATVKIEYKFEMEVQIPNGEMAFAVGPSNGVQRVLNMGRRLSSVRGSAVLEYGRPFPIVALNQKPLELTVTKSQIPSVKAFSAPWIERDLRYWTARYSVHPTNHFYVAATEVDGGRLKDGMVFWKEGRTLVFVAEPIPDAGECMTWGHALKLDRDTVDTSEDIQGSTYLETHRTWATWVESCISRGKLYTISQENARRCYPNVKLVENPDDATRR